MDIRYVNRFLFSSIFWSKVYLILIAEIKHIMSLWKHLEKILGSYFYVNKLSPYKKTNQKYDLRVL